MQYLEAPPSPRFADLVKCFWSLEYTHSGAGSPEPVIPDGCVEIIFNLADRFRRYHTNGDVEIQAASLIAGQMNSSVLIGPTGKVRLFGIRFRPSGAFPFFRFGMNELANRIEPLDSVWGRDVAAVEERLLMADGFNEQTSVAEAFLAERIIDGSPDRWLPHAVNLIASGNGMRPVNVVARELGISERGLERRFRQSVGVSPKMFSRIVRFQRVLKSLESTPEPDILNTALSFGYYDQSHLINDFRQFSGDSPIAFLEKANLMTQIFVGTD
ncbi:MAG: helix-turn-helix domain-containing protein [Pyrinomonadaceae bacterium]